MHSRNAGRGCTVVSYGHRWNNVAIQLGDAPEIAYCDAPVDARRLQHLISQRAWPCGKMNLREHGRIATRANADDSAAQCEKLFGTGRAVMGGHLKPSRKRETS
jgi:hypothetical protein